MDNLKFVETDSLDGQQKLSLMELWNNQYPVNLAYSGIDDFEKYLADLKELRHILLVDETKNILGWTFSFVRDNERWFAIILSSSIHGKGFGKVLLDRLKSSEQELNGWITDHSSYKKSNGQDYLSPIGFYKKTGFTVLSDQRLELEKLSAVKIKWTR